MATKTETKIQEVHYDPWSDTVRIKLFKDNDKYKDDLFVAVNGHRYNIKRGEYVDVPKCIAEVIRKGEIQDIKVAELIDQLKVIEDK